MREAYYIKSVEDVLESMSHGEILTKFIAYDKGDDKNDFTVEIHGFVNSQGQLIITHEKVERIMVGATRENNEKE